MTFQTSVCHYSFHRLWQAEKWDCERLCAEVVAAGAAGVDFHQRLTGDPKTAPERIRRSLEKSGLKLSGISLGNNYNQQGEALEKELEGSRQWLDIAADVKAPVCRVFGGGATSEDRKVQMARITEVLKRITEYAAKKNLVLALENHGGLPSSGEEQKAVIEAVKSEHLRATIDVGNYMSGGQEGADGTRIAAKYARYVHFKDFMKVPSTKNAWGWDVKSCTVGVGAVDHLACMKHLAKAGFKGWVALEYEGPGDERIGVAESIYFMKKVLAKVS
jgi:sugar phosphate isomerase/epimerase